jgi:hypothetical protein
MIDWDMATGKFYAMTAWSNIPITKYYGFFYQPQETSSFRRGCTDHLSSRL